MIGSSHDRTKRLQQLDSPWYSGAQDKCFDLPAWLHNFGNRTQMNRIFNVRCGKPISSSNLSDEANIAHKDDKYKDSSVVSFSSNLLSTRDLQGWRNTLIKALRGIELSVPSKVVDFGCGLGDKSLLIAKTVNVKKVACVDYSSSAISKAKKNLQGRGGKNVFDFYCMDARDACQEFSEDSIDIAIMFGFLHEVNNFEPLLQQMSHRLKPNGLLVISDNNLSFSTSDLKEKLVAANLSCRVFQLRKALRTRIVGEHFHISLFRHLGRIDKTLAVCSPSENEISSRFLQNLASQIRQ